MTTGKPLLIIAFASIFTLLSCSKEEHIKSRYELIQDSIKKAHKMDSFRIAQDSIDLRKLEHPEEFLSAELLPFIPDGLHHRREERMRLKISNRSGIVLTKGKIVFGMRIYNDSLEFDTIKANSSILYETKFPLDTTAKYNYQFSNLIFE